MEFIKKPSLRRAFLKKFHSLEWEDEPREDWDIGEVGMYYTTKACPYFALYLKDQYSELKIGLIENEDKDGHFFVFYPDDSTYLKTGIPELIVDVSGETSYDYIFKDFSFFYEGLKFREITRKELLESRIISSDYSVEYQFIEYHLDHQLKEIFEPLRKKLSNYY